MTCNTASVDVYNRVLAMLDRYDELSPEEMRELDAAERFIESYIGKCLARYADSQEMTDWIHSMLVNLPVESRAALLHLMPVFSSWVDPERTIDKKLALALAEHYADEPACAQAWYRFAVLMTKLV